MKKTLGIFKNTANKIFETIILTLIYISIIGITSLILKISGKKLLPNNKRSSNWHKISSQVNLDKMY